VTEVYLVPFKFGDDPFLISDNIKCERLIDLTDKSKNFNITNNYKGTEKVWKINIQLSSLVFEDIKFLKDNGIKIMEYK